MSPQTVVGRIESLEQRVTHLGQLPARVDALGEQISQLREEMRGEFSAVRAEMSDALAAVREEMRAGDEETRRVLGDQIRAGNAEVMGQVRMLHEDVMSRFALMQEGKIRRGRKR